ncbi:DUF3558 family protein [Streptomyces sp. NPDC050704]|uniref:DUF3558 family protein n=1 Tax=Streptomyces sp. NPDC050704 TaxID=3157219 RepID=UPI00343F206E
MHRPVQRQRLTRILVCAAAVPVMLIASGCSSDSGSDSGSGGDAKKDSSAEASPSATKAGAVVKKEAYAKLPEPCGVFSSKTLKELVPEGTKSNKVGKSDDTSTRGSCSWNSLDNNGVKGSQFRWLNVSLLRFESNETRGAGDKLAAEYYATQLEDAKAVSGAKGVKSRPVLGTGEEATLVTYDLKKKEGTFKQQTVVTRVENVVVTIDYNGAGLAGDKAPTVDDLSKSAEKAAKEAVQAVVTANGGGDAAGSGSGAAPSKSPSQSAGKSPSKSPSKSAGKDSDSSDEPSAGPSKSAAKN